MYLMYLDESGDPNGWQTGQNHFVLGGLAVHEGQVRAITQQLDAIQQEFFPGISIPITFHATDIRGGKDRFRGLQQGDRERLLGAIYQVFARSRFPYLVAFASAMHVSAASSQRQVLHDTFQDVCLSFNTFFVRGFRRGIKNKGLLIIDHAHEEHYRELLADFQTANTEHGYVGNVVDIPYFARRHDTRMLQLADFCAFAVFRYYENGDTRYLDLIHPRFDRQASSDPEYGLKHITRSDCACIACNRRQLARDAT